MPGAAIDRSAWPIEAVILAGGAGTRLRSVVSDVPKPLAPVAGRPFIEYLLLQVRAAGIARVVICSGYRAGTIEAELGTGERWGVSIRYSVEDAPLGTGGALRHAQPMLAGERWLVMNGDSLFDISLADLFGAHARRPAPATLALASVGDASRYGGVTLARDGTVSAFVEKPPDAAPKCINGGLYIIDRTTLDLIPADRPVSLEHEVFGGLVGRGLRGVALDGYFVDIGVPADFMRAQAASVFARLAASRPR